MIPYTASHEPPYACCPSSSRLPDSLSPSHLPLDPFKEAILCQQLFELQSIGILFIFNHHITVLAIVSGLCTLLKPHAYK